jgi:hypothetical protein
MSYVGIDPGKDGAVAALDDLGEIEDIFDMPLEVVGKRANGKVKYQVNAHMLAGILEAWNEDDELIVVMEKVNASPQMGSVSSYSFGEGVGIIKGVLAALKIEVVLITPNEWKKFFDLPGGRENKDQSLELARAQWSHVADREWFRLKKHSDRAEAALMALYAQSKLG